VTTQENPDGLVSVADIWTVEVANQAQVAETHTCACCGKPGHHVDALEAKIRAEGFRGGVTLDEHGRLKDGHHRLGMTEVPIEPEGLLGERWQRDQEALMALVPWAPVPCEVWRWAQATQEALYGRGTSHG
jgi:hypothetical protein